MIINGVELPDLDLADLEIAEKFETEFQKCADKAAALKPQTNRVAVIKGTCRAVFEVFDNLFGDGTAKKIFGNKTNIILCNRALAELVEGAREIDRENAQATNEIFAKYNPDRAVR